MKSRFDKDKPGIEILDNVCLLAAAFPSSAMFPFKLIGLVVVRAVT